MEETNKKYTAKDFDRYYSGAMSVHEMHALEKAALEDPFLADALEGYLNTAHFEDDIAELKIRLQRKERKQNVFSIATISQNRWWRIAALFIIICGAGFLLYRIDFIKRENSIVRNEIKTLPEKKENIAPVIKDSNSANNDIAFEDRAVTKPSQKPKHELIKPLTKSDQNNYAPQAKNQAEDMASLSKPKDTFVEKNIAMDDEDRSFNKKPENKYFLKGTVTDSAGAPVSYATVTQSGTRNATTADANGQFAIQSKDSSMTAVATASGFESKPFQLNTDTTHQIVMNRNNEELSDVVVTGYGSSKSRKLKASRSDSKALQGRVAGVMVSTDRTRPFPKNDKFEKYLADNTGSLFNDKGERITGEVLLLFSINKKGRPTNIKVVKSDCEECEEEAISLLEKGPDWKNIKQKVGTTLINFK